MKMLKKYKKKLEALSSTYFKKVKIVVESEARKANARRRVYEDYKPTGVWSPTAYNPNAR